MSEPSDDSLSDDALIGRCLQARAAADAASSAARAAFEGLYARHAAAVLAFLTGLHRGDQDAARDALQETFLRFYTALPSFQRGRPVRPWLHRIARNVSLDAWKKARPKGELEADPADGGPAPPELAARCEGEGLLRRAVLALPPEERAVFLLRHDEGRTFDEAAEALGCSVRTAKYRMQAALARLAREAERLGLVEAARGR